MKNKAIISLLKSTATLLVLHGANPFRASYYSNAALFLEKIEDNLASLSLEALGNIPGLSQSVAALIHEISTTETLQRWEGLMAKTPQGVLAMLELKGMGPKKVRALWKELGIESLAALEQACTAGQVAQLPGFGQKTQAAIQESLAWKDQQQGKFHYATALPYATALVADLQQAFPALRISLVGTMRRTMEVVTQVEILVGTRDTSVVAGWLQDLPTIEQSTKISGPSAWRGRFLENGLSFIIHFCPPEYFYKHLILQTGVAGHLALPVQAAKSLGAFITKVSALDSEVAGYQQAGLPYIPPELREGIVEQAWIQAGGPLLLVSSELRGVLHAHTTYSDGGCSLEAMARSCQEQGYEYLGITDHSQVASYAGGLTIEAVQRQHQAIDQLNRELAPFRIFKGIESDILPDGSLDYPAEVLASFDFVIASVHVGLSMDQQRATDRLMKAIRNPFTTILGHLTGRLLLKRAGYPIDHQAIIDACAANGVIIELNANPWRMELDWRWIRYAIEKNVWLSINPDAHDQADIDNMYYGVCIGRKGGLTKQHTFNTLSSKEVAEHFQRRKAAALG
ncbi:MAG: helix-hairpin-helix domain-containing protein [Bacteroidota bacterium]